MYTLSYRPRHRDRVTEWGRLSICPSVSPLILLFVRPVAHNSGTEAHKKFKSGGNSLFPHACNTPISEQKGQGPTDFSNWRLINTYKKSSAEMLTISFNSVSVGFSERSHMPKPMFWFSKVCNGEWLLLYALDITIRCLSTARVVYRGGHPPQMFF